MTRLIVRPHNPTRVRLLTALAAVALFASGWGLFEYGRYSGGYNIMEAKAERKRLQQLNGEQIAENQRLREQLAVLARSSEIEKEAYDQLKGTVAALQDEILELKEELAFYRGIVSPRDGHEGLKVQNFEVMPGLSAEQWHYKLVLTQVLKNDTVATGAVQMVLKGTQSGEPKTLSMAEVDGKGRKSLAFRFKYFQDFEGDFRLPEGFRPEQVAITVDPSGRGRERFEQTFDWPAEES